MPVQVGKMACLHTGDSWPKKMLWVRPVTSHSCSLQGVKPQPLRLKTKRTDGNWRVAPMRSSSCPSSHGCQLRPTEEIWGREEGRKEGRAPDHGI